MTTPNDPSAPLAPGLQREDHPRDSSPLSLSRLREAFAEMLGDGAARRPEPDAGTGGDAANTEYSVLSKRHAQQLSRVDPPAPSCEISPRSVVEAILFVGRPDNQSFSARELAAAMRGVSPLEIDAAIAELNTTYDHDATPYRIERTNSGYRLVLGEEFERMRDKFYGRIREARLSRAAVEALSIVAYNQPVTADQVNELRGASSGAALSTLVRRKLVRLQRATDSEPAYYSTTERFLRLFGLENLAALPRSEELGKS